MYIQTREETPSLRIKDNLSNASVFTITTHTHTHAYRHICFVCVCVHACGCVYISVLCMDLHVCMYTVLGVNASGHSANNGFLHGPTCVLCMDLHMCMYTVLGVNKKGLY